MKTDILGVPVDVVTRAEALDILLGFLHEERNHIVVTPNPEFVMEAQKDPEFMHILHEADLVVPDGTGIVLASLMNKTKLKERVPGCDLTYALFDKIRDMPVSVYLLGAAPGVAEKAKENMEKKFPGIKIIGTSDGYFDKRKERIIIREIQILRPEILIVGLGSPRQEKWMYDNRKRLPVRISIGVGGGINIMSGVVKRAPVFFRKLGLEWLYRLLCQPQRIGRMLKLPVFVLKVIRNGGDKKNKR